MNTKNHKSYDVSFIIVHHNDARHLTACLSSLLSHVDPAHHEVIVIDGASPDQTWKEVLQPFASKIICHELAKNKGFGVACNVGARLARGTILFFLNPDLEFPVNPLPLILDFFKDHSDAGTLGPKLNFPDGRLQPSRGSFPHLLLTAAQIFKIKRLLPPDEDLIPLVNRFLGRSFAQWGAVKGIQQVDYTLGAALIIRKDIFHLLDGFDENFFLYFEEIDLCKRLCEHGYRNYYIPEVCLIHHMDSSVESHFGLKNIAYVESLLYYYRKHHSNLRYYAVYLLLSLHTTWTQFFLACRKIVGRLEANDFSRQSQVNKTIRDVMRQSLLKVKCRIGSS